MKRLAAALAASVLAAGLAVAAGCLEPPRFKPCTPLPAPDAGNSCEPDETCQFTSPTSLRCVPAGDAGDQAPCREERCAHGFFCATPPNATQPLCLGLCREDKDCPQDAGMELCSLALYEGGPASLCQRFTPCEPLVAPSSCSWFQKCSLLALPGPYVCLTPTDDRRDYEPCEAETDCAADFACVRYGEGPSYCVQFCGTDDDCPQAGGLELCLRRNFPERPPVFCERVQACSPDQPSSCPAGQSCYPYKSSGRNHDGVLGLCRTTGGKPQGAPCDYLNDCAPGLACLEAYPGAQPTCRPLCTTDYTTLRCQTGSCIPINSVFGACD